MTEKQMKRKGNIMVKGVCHSILDMAYPDMESLREILDALGYDMIKRYPKTEYPTNVIKGKTVWDVKEKL